MRKTHSDPARWAAGLLVGLTLLVGCTRQPQPTPTAKRAPAAERTPAPGQPAPDRVSLPSSPAQPAPPENAQEEPPAPETPVKISDPTAPRGLSDDDVALPVQKPSVLLSTQHAAACRVKPDDGFPDLSLQTPDGTASRLAEHFGQRLTVVVFWDCQHPMSIEQVSRLDQEVRQLYGGVGVGVVAINVGDSAEALQKLLSQIDHGFVTLWDRDRQAYAQVATGLMPRTFLLDADGKILWLDVEYSRSTRRQLRNAILYHLRQQLQAAQQQADPLM